MTPGLLASEMHRCIWLHVFVMRRMRMWFYAASTKFTKIFYCENFCIKGCFFIIFKDFFIHVNFIKLAEAAKEQSLYPHDFFVQHRQTCIEIRNTSKKTFSSWAWKFFSFDLLLVNDGAYHFNLLSHLYSISIQQFWSTKKNFISFLFLSSS